MTRHAIYEALIPAGCPASGMAACYKYSKFMMVLRPKIKIQINWNCATSRMLNFSAIEYVGHQLRSSAGRGLPVMVCLAVIRVRAQRRWPSASPPLTACRCPALRCTPAW